MNNGNYRFGILILLLLYSSYMLIQQPEKLIIMELQMLVLGMHGLIVIYRAKLILQHMIMVLQ